MTTCPQCNFNIEEGIRFCPRCGANVEAAKKPSADPYIGRKIKDNFLVLELIGQGGMGKVYRAEQISLGKKVCLKILHQNMVGDPDLAKRFHREARAASRLNHPNSINIIDFGTAEDGCLFMAMEYVEGIELGELIENEFPLPAKRIVNILSQVCSALAEAHEHKVVHRDLKPENILIEKRRDGEDFVKVLDFGIAKVLDPQEDEIAAANLTKAGVVCGTPEYMSPEQAKGEPLDSRSDIYSLGVILYQMLTKDIPFHAPTSMGIVTKHLLEPPVPPSRIRPEVPGPLETVCMRALKKDRNRRQSSALEFKAELEQALEAIKIGSPVASKPVPLPAAKKPIAQVDTGQDGVPDSTETPFPTMNGQGRPPIAVKAAPPSSTPPLTAEEPVMVPVKGGKHRMLIFSGMGIAAIILVVVLYFVFAGKKNRALDTGAANDIKNVKTNATASNDNRNSGHVNNGTQQQAGSSGKQGTESKQDLHASNANANISPPGSKSSVHKKKKRHGSRIARTSRIKSAIAYYKKGNELFLQGEIKAAIMNYRKAIKYNKNMANAYKKLGTCYMGQQKMKTAKAYYKKYLRLKPGARDSQQIKNIIQQIEKAESSP
ncbi:MAG: protein kinase [Deltaproteobacteria bacterium]|nr:protein kinase [Deltaproteobacteria bacterium]